MDWPEHHVQLQPLASQLYEAMNLQEWDKAVALSERLLSVASRMHAVAHIERDKACPRRGSV